MAEPLGQEPVTSPDRDKVEVECVVCGQSCADQHGHSLAEVRAALAERTATDE